MFEPIQNALVSRQEAAAAPAKVLHQTAFDRVIQALREGKRVAWFVAAPERVQRLHDLLLWRQPPVARMAVESMPGRSRIYDYHNGASLSVVHRVQGIVDLDLIVIESPTEADRAAVSRTSANIIEI